MLIYYAMGGGQGHALRGIAILRHLGEGLLIAPKRMKAWCDQAGVERFELTGDPTPRDFDSLSPSLLLMDVFPRGVGGEATSLVERADEAWLISRTIRTDFYLEASRRKFLETRFARIVFGEPPPAELTVIDLPSQVVPPILMHHPPRSRRDGRVALGVDDATPLVIALGSGDAVRQKNTLRLLRKLTEQLGAELRFFSTSLPSDSTVRRDLAAARFLPAADVVVSAAGYHSFHELRAAGVAAIFLPQQRRYDRQFDRARHSEIARDPADLARRLAERIAAPSPSTPINRGDGAAEVARLVRDHLGKARYPTDRRGVR